MKSNPEIAFITLNPGRSGVRHDHPSPSCEKGSPYLDESWGGKEPSESKLQIQIQEMFKEIHEKVNYPGSNRKLIESTLSGHFVPFRSPSLEKLKDKKEAFAFGEKIWSEILASVRPRLFVRINTETREHLRKIIKNVYKLPERKLYKPQTGWGNYTAEIIEFGYNAQIKLLWLPHLYRFTRRETSEKEIENIFSQFCGAP